MPERRRSLGWVTAVVALIGTCLSAGPGKVKGMDDLKIVCEPVAGVEDPGGDKDGTLRLKDGSTCALGRKDPRFAVWIRLIKAAEMRGMPVYLECEAGQAKTVLPAAARVIESVDPDAKDGRLKVVIFMSPSPHFLDTTRSNFNELRQFLVKAAQDKEKKPVLLVVEPKDMEILDARPVPEGLKPTVI